MKRYLRKQLKRVFRSAADNYMTNISRDTQRDLKALHLLGALTGHYAPWTQWALTPSAVVTILNDVVLNKRQHIIEFGSGISTIYLARLLANSDQYFYSVDQNMNWIDNVRQILERENLAHHVRFIHAPLKPCELALEPGGYWYDLDTIYEATDFDTFDLIIVDGPTHPATRCVRYPAVPAMKDYLAQKCTIIADDAQREPEQYMLSQWEEMLSARFERISEIAVLINGDHFDPFLF